MKCLSIDFGGSTIDVLHWDNEEIKKVDSYERGEVITNTIHDFLEEQKVELDGIQEIRVTGGKSHVGDTEVKGIPVSRIDEIEAIGKGGSWLFKGQDCLTVSMGTGTCMVAIRGGEFMHVGGTGVGGGTFLSLSKMLLKEVDPEVLVKLFQSGDSTKVDLSVGEIVGRAIGRVKAETTASNLGKIVRSAEEIDFGKADLAVGITNLIGQTIATAAVFAARAEDLDTIVLTGKLTRMRQVVDVIFEVGELYDRKIVLPEKAEFVSAIGAAL